MRKLKEPTSMRLSERTKRLMVMLSELNDITQTAVVEQAVREMAARQNIKIEDTPISRDAYEQSQQAPKEV